MGQHDLLLKFTGRSCTWLLCRALCSVCVTHCFVAHLSQPGHHLKYSCQFSKHGIINHSHRGAQWFSCTVPYYPTDWTLQSYSPTLGHYDSFPCFCDFSSIIPSLLSLPVTSLSLLPSRSIFVVTNDRISFLWCWVVCVRAHLCACVCVCVHVCMYVGLCVCTYVCMFLPMCVHIQSRGQVGIKYLLLSPSLPLLLR